MNRLEIVTNLGITAVMIAAVLLLQPSAAFSADNKLASEFMEQLTGVVSENTANADALIVLCQVPQSTELIANDQGVIAEEKPEYSQIAVALTLSKLRVLDQLRGQCDSLIFVQYLIGMSELLRYRPFTYTPGSKWVLFLSSPLNDNHPAHQSIVNPFAALNAGAFLSVKNFFQIQNNGFAAVCVEWPKTEPPPDGLTIATPTFVNDLKLIVQRQQEMKTNPDNLTPRDTIGAQLHDAIAQAVFRAVTK